MADTLIQLLVNALALAAAYGLVALAFVLVLNAVGAVNFASGDLVMAGGFVAIAASQAVPEGTDGIVVLPLVMGLTAGLGLLLGSLAWLPLRNRPAVSIFISTIAAGSILHQGANALFGSAPASGPSLFGGGALALPFGAAMVSVQQLAIIVTGGSVMLACHLLLTRTRAGLALRAAAEDPEMARMLAINPTRTALATFALAGMLAGAAGMMLSNQFLVTPDSGALFMLKAYVAVVLGGWGRIGGALAGALIIAIMETLGGLVFSPVFAEALLYLVVFAILLFRPQGLFGETVGRRA